MFNKAGRWDRNIQLSCQCIGFALVPRPLDTLPTGSWNAKDLAQLRAVARKGSNQLIAGWIKYPVPEPQSPAKFQQTSHRFGFIFQARQLYKFGRVFRE